jgi:hypothetical protein
VSAPVTSIAPRSTGTALADQLFAPLRKGEGVRIGLVGDSGCGKTWAARLLLAEWCRRVPNGFALVHDDTGPLQFRGQVRRFVTDIAKQPLAPEPRIVIFRGDERVRSGVNPSSLAEYAWRCAYRSPPVPMLLLLDELGRAAYAGHWSHQPNCPKRKGRGPGGMSSFNEREAECTCPLPAIFSWGRRSCVSVIWTTQSPQNAPREAFEQSSALVCVHMGGRGLRYLRDLDYLDGGAEPAIARQPGTREVAAGAVPAYVMLERGSAWDGKEYRL